MINGIGVADSQGNSGTGSRREVKRASFLIDRGIEDGIGPGEERVARLAREALAMLRGLWGSGRAAWPWPGTGSARC